MMKINTFFTLFLYVTLALLNNIFASDVGNSSGQMNINHNQRSDTLNVLHYHVNLNITSVASSPISGFTDVKVTPKLNGITTLNLDLLRNERRLCYSE